MTFQQKLESMAERVNLALEDLIPLENSPQQSIYRAMRYSIDAGGKRLRPVLALAVSELLGGRTEDIMPYACAIEMIHTYSLIHDDLPAMDNDDYRRGKPTNHKVFGEALAILAGDSLLNHAFEVMLEDMTREGNTFVPLEYKARAARIISDASGARGMIGGQVVDLESEGKSIPRELLEHMHRCKTGALIKAPVLAAAALNGASTEDTVVLEFYAERLGLAFQIKDDILDVEGDLSIMGKPQGSDAANGKSTFVTIFGMEESKRMLADITEEAVEKLKSRFGERALFLKDLAQFLLSREH